MKFVKNVIKQNTMKTIYTLITILFLTTTTVFSQYSYVVKKINPNLVPKEVITEFEDIFSDVKTIRWEKHTGKGKKRSHVKYVVIFDKDGIRSRARYNPDGSGISATSYYWFKKGVAKLPAKVKNYTASQHPGFKVNSGEKVISLKSSKYIYRLRLRKGTSKLVVYVNESGEMIDKNNLPSEFTGDENEK